jgi:hypothetical protein
MKYLPLFFAVAVLLSEAQGANSSKMPSASKALPDPSATPAPTADSGDSSWVFSLLPKSAQKNPNLEMSVITTFTDLGKTLPLVTPEHPAYYVLQSAGYHSLGQISANDAQLTPEQLQQMMTKALAANGFLEAKPPATPTLVIIYSWGSHAKIDPNDETVTGETLARNLLDRALLVGGEKFAAQLKQIFDEKDAMVESNPPAAKGAFGPNQQAFADPVNLFRLQSTKNEFLLDQTAGNVYFATASAYEYSSLAAGQKKLLWRTRMTVASDGVSQTQSLPTLIVNAAPFFGKEMAEPATLVKRADLRDGKVEIGTAVVVEPTPTPTPHK